MNSRLTVLLFSMFGLGAQAQYSGNLKVEELLASESNGIGQKIIYPKFDDAKVTIRKITFPAGSSTGWHKHEIPVFSYIIQGKLTVEFEGQKTINYTVGNCFAESTNTYHRGINKEDGDLVVLVLYLGGDGKRLSISKPNR